MGRNKRTIKPVKIDRRYYIAYRNLIVKYAKQLNLIIARRLFDLLKYLQPKYAKNSVLMFNDESILNAFSWIDEQADMLYEQYGPLVVSLLVRMKDNDQERFYKNLSEQTGISLKNILEGENIQDSFALAIKENLNLIKTLSQKQLSRVQNVVLSNLRAGNFQASEIKKQLVDDFGMSERHAKFIARDQSHKMTSNLNQLRYENLGVTKYIWRTSKDRRVRGDPDGKYPKAKPSHYVREGKIYSFAKPPAGGNPGEPINCRCYAEPILPEEYTNL